MKRLLFQRWAIWLLPLLLVRAFVPAGFMLSAQAGELSVVFCSGVVTTAQQSSDQLAHQHHASHSADTSASSTEPKSDGIVACPFAASGTAATIELPYFVGQFAPPDYDHPTLTLPFASAGPQRADRIRGPPALI